MQLSLIFQDRARQRRVEQPLQVLQPRGHPQQLDHRSLLGPGHPDDRLHHHGRLSPQPAGGLPPT